MACNIGAALNEPKSIDTSKDIPFYSKKYSLTFDFAPLIGIRFCDTLSLWKCEKGPTKGVIRHHRDTKETQKSPKTHRIDTKNTSAGSPNTIRRGSDM